MIPCSVSCRLVSFVFQPNERRFTQAERVKLTRLCQFDNSLGDDFAHYFRLAGVAKLFTSSVKSFAHGRRCLRAKFATPCEENDRHVSTRL